MSAFHPLTVAEVRRETPDTVSVAFDVPAELADTFSYTQGQYLTFKLKLDGEELRRSYSLCSSPARNEKLRVAVKEVEQGRASAYFNRTVKAGDIIETMAPEGNFYTELNAAQAKHYVGFAVGSGITPIHSILHTVLLKEPQSRFTLVYGNRSIESVIFGRELDQLLQEYSGRFKLLHVWSRQDTGVPELNGRIDELKTAWLCREPEIVNADEFFICGPEAMIMQVSETLQKQGVKKEKIHFELFTTPVLMKSEATAVDEATDFSGDAEITVIMDGIETAFTLSSKGMSILDAAIEAGADAPYSCKGAVCCTCKAKVTEGKAIMDMNYALTDREVAEGYVLTCQAHPQSGKVVVDYDVP